MKTTNFEISKKLKEIGFEAEFNFHYKATDHINLYDSGYEDYKERNTPSYDLETLINALPDKITREYKSTEDGTIKEFEERLVITKNEIYYKCYDIGTEDDANEYWREYGYYAKFSEVVKDWEDESLADTAGRLLIKLHEAGIINFKK